MTLESIAWRGVHVEVPDTNRTVLVYGPLLEFDEGQRVWLAWYEDGAWFSVDAGPLDKVTHWAEMPKGAD